MVRLFSGSLLAAAAVSLGALGCSVRTATTEPRASLSPASASGSDRAADLCAGLSGTEQQRPYFLREDGIEAVRPVHEGSGFRFASSELRGAEIVLRPAPAVTKHWVARVLRCHLADVVALAMRDTLDDPFVVGAPQVSLDETSDRIVLRIVGRDAALGEEILRRAEQLRRHEDRPDD
jgi:hypothetical protein